MVRVVSDRQILDKSVLLAKIYSKLPPGPEGGIFQKIEDTDDVIACFFTVIFVNSHI